MRFLAAVRTDVLLQARNQLFAISAGVAALVGGALAWLASPDNLHGTLPLAVLMFVGGSTLLYVVAMMILEKEDGTLDAVSVSPLRPWEYLASKVTTLTALATFEGALIITVALAVLSREGPVPLPNPALVLLGLVLLGILHVLVGIVLVVRYERLSEALLPMTVLALLFQIPAFWFLDAIAWPPLLAIPSGAPAMFIRAAITPLEPWQWIYAIVGTAVTIGLLAWWSVRAFVTHIVARAGQ